MVIIFWKNKTNQTQGTKIIIISLSIDYQQRCTNRRYYKMRRAGRQGERRASSVLRCRHAAALPSACRAKRTHCWRTVAACRWPRSPLTTSRAASPKRRNSIWCSRQLLHFRKIYWKKRNPIAWSKKIIIS